MSQGRIIVTVVITLFSLIVSVVVGCTGQMRSVRQGETRLSEMQRIKGELASAYLIELSAESEPSTSVNALSPELRQRAHELLTRFVTLSDEVLRLDDQKGVAVTNRDRIESERDQAKRLATEPAR